MQSAGVDAQRGAERDGSSGALYGLAGLALVVEYVALGLAYDFEPIRKMAAVGRVGELVNEGVTVAIVAMASLGLLLVARRGAVSLTAIGARLVRARSKIAIHGACYLALFAWSHRNFHTGSPPEVAVGVGVTWLVLAVAVAASAVSVAYVPFPRVPTRTIVIAALGALVAVFLTVALADFANVLWQPLQEATLRVVAGLASLTYPDLLVELETATVGTPRFSVVVAPMCSGVEGMGLMTMLMPTFVWLNRERFQLPRAFWLVPIGVVGAWLANCVRIFLLVVLGNEVSPVLAVGAFHSRAGWLFFALLTVGLAAYAIRSPVWCKRLAGGQQVESHVDVHNPAAPFLAPLVVLVAVSMLTGMFAIGTDFYYGLRAPAVLVVVWLYRDTYRQLARGFSLVPAVVAGVLAFVVWWLLSEPAWLPDWTRLSGHHDPAMEHASAEELARGVGPAWLLVRALVSATIVPFAEELAFRGYLLRRLSRRDFEALPWIQASVVGIAGSSLAFGVLHDAWLAGAAAGLIFAIVQKRTGSIANAVVAHAVANAGVAAAVLTTGAWGQWF